jgi:PAS domain S-box-containing protein
MDESAPDVTGRHGNAIRRVGRMAEEGDGSRAGHAAPILVRGTEIDPADERRRYREKIARVTLDSMVQFVWLLDADGTVLESNKVALDAVGVQLSEVEKRPFWTTSWWQVSPEVGATLREKIARAARGEFVRWVAEIYGRAGGRETTLIDASLMPVTDDAGTVVFLCAEGRVITEKKAREPGEASYEPADLAVRESDALHRVLSDLAAMTQPLTDPAEIMAASARLLAEHLGADRCAYAEVEDESVYVITGDFTRGVSSITGRWEVAAFGAQHLQDMRAGEPWVVDDAEADSRIAPEDLAAYGATDIRAVICVPLHKGGRLTAAMAVHQKTARRWRPEEIRLVRAVVGQCWEALERARVSRTLQESEEQFRTLVTATSDVVYQMSPDWTEMRHLDGREFIASTLRPSGTWLQQYIPPEDQPRVAAAIAESMRERKPFEMEHRVLRVDGTVGWTFSRAIPVLDGTGEVAGWFGAARDVTRRKEAEQELARVIGESERRKRLYEAILSSTPDFVYVFSLDYRVLYANPALVAMWGAGDPVGRTFLEIGYEPWHAEMHAREIDQVRATKEPIRGEVPFAGTTGRRIYDYIFVPVLGADGEVEAVAGTTRDVTDRKAMEEDARDADRRKDEFIALLAHELRNPLAPIRNALEVMRLASGNPAALAEARGVMDRQLSHMVRLIDDLLDVSRITRNKMELRRSRVALSEVVASAVETARPQIDEAGHELTLSLPAVPVHLDADLTRLAQLFSNLLTNSARYTPPGGRVWLSAERKGGHVQVSVRDTGIGIPAEALGNIFDMFAQVDRPLERATGGLGIGLALVKGLVEMHGGTVTAASEGEGKGSTFTVTLPVLADLPDTAGKDAAPEPADRGPSRRILVVDDNRDGADSLAMMLTLMGHEVETANDGIEAVEGAARLRPDLILMDVGMPRLNGLDATRRIREQPWGRAITIIALTGWGQAGDKEDSRAAGCNGHLVKPVHLPDLERLLKDGTP